MISLAIVADIRLYREGLAEVLDRQPDIRVVGTASSDEAGARRIVQAAPDVALLDMAMPASAAIARMLGDSGAGIAVLALGVPETESTCWPVLKSGWPGTCRVREASRTYSRGYAR